MHVRSESRNPKGKPSKVRLLLLSLAAVLIFALLMAGCGKKASAPESSSDKKQGTVLIDGLSADQSQLVQQYGYPDQFEISFDPSTSKRMETWIYYSQTKSIDFSDGQTIGEGTAEDQSSKYPATSLHPQDFNQTTTPEEAAAILGQPVYTQDVEDSLMGGTNTLVVFNNAILQYRDGELLIMETQVKPPAITVP
jgi:outer membrane murein-binding lipoprotein Lpp